MVDILLGLKNRIPKEQPRIGNEIEYSFIKTSDQDSCSLGKYLDRLWTPRFWENIHV